MDTLEQDGVEAGKLLALIVNSTEDAVISITRGNLVRSWNNGAKQLFGYSKEEAIGRPIEQLIVSSEQIPDFLRTLDLLWLDADPIREEAVYCRKDGTHLHAHASFATIKTEANEIIGLSFIAHDITQRKDSEEALQKANEALKETLEQFIQTIAAAVEARDPYTAGHQRRVSELATAIAEELGLTDEQINGVHLAALVHDLGKIRIPSEILVNPAKLTYIEYELIKTHSQAGYIIIKDIKFPWPIRNTILQHHERMDGSGYPQGLKGDDILLEARIIAVADVIEAMSSHRPYRPAIGIIAALNEIKRGRGKIYDPDVVDACVELFNEKDFQFSNAS